MTILTSLRSLRGLSLVLTAAVFMLFAGSAAPHVAAECVIPDSSLPGACEEPAPAAPAKNDDICFTTNATVAEKDGKLSVYYRTTSTDNITTLIMEIELKSLTLTTYANGIAAWVGQSKITGLTSWWVMISKDTKITDSSYVVTVGKNMSINDKGEATGGIEAVTGCGLTITPNITPYSAPAPKCEAEKTAVATAKATAATAGAAGIVAAKKAKISYLSITSYAADAAEAAEAAKQTDTAAAVYDDLAAAAATDGDAPAADAYRATAAYIRAYAVYLRALSASYTCLGSS